MIRPSLIMLGIAAFALSACGKQGDLERPAPMFGEKARANYEAEQAAAAAAKAKKKQPSAREPLPGDPREANPLAPARAAPIPGTNPDPFGAPPSNPQ